MSANPIVDPKEQASCLKLVNTWALLEAVFGLITKSQIKIDLG